MTSTIPFKTQPWHDCNGKIGQHISLAVAPPPRINDGQPFWFLTLLLPGSRTELPIKFCPICGEELPALARREG